MAHYRLFLPAQAVGANLVYFDLFNAAGSGSTVNLKSVLPVVSGSGAVTGVVSVDLFLTKTTAVGTGGTAATSNGTSLTAATFTGHDTTQPLDALITARLTPSGGATAGAVISWESLFSEETSAGTYIVANDLVTNSVVGLPPIALGGGQGVRVVQGAVASVGIVGFNVIFEVVPK